MSKWVLNYDTLITRNITFKKSTLIFNLLVIIIFAFYLKHIFYLHYIGYDQIPDPNIILDERTWVWQGLSVRSTGVPAGWSQLSPYKTNSLNNGSAALNNSFDVKNFNIAVDQQEPKFLSYYKQIKPVLVLNLTEIGGKKINLPIVQPLLEQPPLGGVLLSLGVSNSIKTFAEMKADSFRKSPMYLSIVTSILIFILGWVVSKNIIVGFIGGLVYNSAPSFLLLSRFSLLENTSVIFLLSSLIFLNLADLQKVKKVWFFLFASGIFAGLATLTKITAWTGFMTGLFLLIFWKYPFKKISLFSLPALFLGIIYFIWAIYLDGRLFKDIVLYQGKERGFIGSINFLVTLTQIGIKNFPLDGWWIGGFLSLVLVKYKKEYLSLYFGFIINLIVALVLGGANYPWYFIPLIPFMCIFTAIFIQELISNPNIKNILIFFLIFFSTSFYYGYGVYKAVLSKTHDQQPFLTYRLIFLLFIFFSILFCLKLKSVKLVKSVWIVFCIFVLGYTFLTLNERGFLYILDHWGKLPSIYTPGTF